LTGGSDDCAELAIKPVNKDHKRNNVIEQRMVNLDMRKLKFDDVVQLGERRQLV
jgi:hypothetical protein